MKGSRLDLEARVREARVLFAAFHPPFLVALVVKNPPANADDIRDMGLVPGSRQSLGGGHGNPLPYSCLEDPMDKGALPATVHSITKSQTRLKRLSRHTPTFPANLAAQRVEGCGHQDTKNILQPLLHLSNPRETKIKHQTTKSGSEPSAVCVDKTSGQESGDEDLN